MSTEQRKKKILDAVEELFSDTSVSQQQTLDALEEILGDVESKANCVRADLEREARKDIQPFGG